jgi:hypothetical protein
VRGLAARSHTHPDASAFPIRRNAIVAGALALTLVAAILTLVALVAPVSAFPGSLLPGNGAYFGARVQPRGSENEQEALRRVEDQIGRKFDIDHRYYTWNQAIPTGAQDWDASTGRIPFVNWAASGAGSWGSIAAGNHDAWIRDRADAFRDFGAPVYLTFHHEPENDVGGFGSPQEYAAAFRRIVDIFRSRGADNVAFVWTLLAWSFSSGAAANYYPGDGWVDFVAADGYNWYPGRPGSTWQSFASVFEETRAFAVAHGKPWIVAEYGVQEDPAQPGRKAQWLRDALTTARSWPDLKAAIYFDSYKKYPWVTDSSPAAMQAYAEMGNDPWFRQQGGGGSPSPTPTPTPTPTPSPEPPPGDTPRVVKNGLNAGPQGANVQAGRDRGGPTPFDAVSTTSGATLTYDATHARGAFSAKHVLNPRSDSYYQWDGTRSVWYGRILVWLPGYPAGDLRLIRASVTGSLRCSINIRTSGRIGFQDRQNRLAAESDVAIPTGRWVRIEWKIDHVRGRVKIKIYSRARSTKPADVVKAGPRLDIGQSATHFQFGRSGSNDFAITFWTDAPAISTRRFLGPGAKH